jgi:hypothetical protein
MSKSLLPDQKSFFFRKNYTFRREYNAVEAAAAVVVHQT